MLLRVNAHLDTLGMQVRTRRSELGLSVDNAARASGMSPVTWGRVEKGSPVRTLSYRGIERVLGWSAGSAEAILAGGEPTPSGQESEPPSQQDDQTVMRDPLVVRILSSPLPDDTKADLIHMVLQNRRRADEGSEGYINAQIEMWDRLQRGA